MTFSDAMLHSLKLKEAYFFAIISGDEKATRSAKLAYIGFNPFCFIGK